jgi:hypothetical protein
MREHVIIDSFFSHLCNGCPTKVYQLKKWVANALHTPNDRTRPMLLLQGIEGGGQELFCSFLEHLFFCIDSRYNSCIITSSPEREVWGRYNKDMLYCRLVCWVDINRVTTLYKYENNIKSLLREPKMHVKYRSSEVAEDLRQISLDNKTSIVAVTSNNINYSDESLTWLLDIRTTEQIPEELALNTMNTLLIPNAFKIIYKDMKGIAWQEKVWLECYQKNESRENMKET